MRRYLFFFLIFFTLAAWADETIFQTGLVLKSAERFRRSAFHVDPVEEMIVKGEWTPPRAGQPLGPGATNRTWQPASASADGTFTNRELRGGYLDCQIDSDADTVKLLSAAGHDVAYVNEEPRPGDPYSSGILELPVKLHRGANDFLFRVSRGRLKARLTVPPRPVMLDLGDPTLPDVLHGDSQEQWGAVVVVNCTTNFIKGASLRVALDRHGAVRTPVPAVPPLSVRKVGFRFEPRWTDRTNRLELSLKLISSDHQQLDSGSLWLSLRRETEHYKQTFISEIDGSVQYFAVAPAQPLPGSPPPRALFLSLHGAGVEASGQAAAYQSKSWGTLVAPTNRRFYGFDWEDWGQRDALEVLDLAMLRFQIDPHQVYLTGHSMGGHGTWHVGVTYPDRFAAIAPSAGWISFLSYGGAERAAHGDPMQQFLQRASNPGDTLALVSNTLHFGVYVLHGDADDNVPVEEARTMRDRLSQFHHDFVYHEQPGAGHWWGNQCVDWPPIFDLFGRHQIPSDNSISDINFTTMDPGVSSSSHWISIEAQQHALNPSSVVAHYDAINRKFNITTENVARLALRPEQIAPSRFVVVTIDGETFLNIGEKQLWFENKGGKWYISSAPSPNLKGPNRYGPFKEAFGHRMMLVYGTKGSPEENAWAAAKSRFDAESWWYRGNGAVDVVPDVDFDPRKESNRGVIIYGNADNNSAWSALLGDSPVQVRRGSVSIESRTLSGGDLACLFCRPRPGSDYAMVAVVSGTGLAGLKLTDRVPYLSAGVAYPDCTVFGVDSLSKGTSGVRTAGFFGMDWSVAAGDFLWRD